MRKKSFNLTSSVITVTDGYPQKNSLSESQDQLQDDSFSSDSDRGQWGNKAEFMLSCIGLSVGLGNVWRFPYLAYKHGGAAFLIAYMVLQLLIGKPLYFMELVMGQYSSKGPTGVWSMNPSAKGIGISMMFISLVVAIYYNVIMGYTLFYFFSSMQTTLPWMDCSKFSNYSCVSERLICVGNMTIDKEGCLCPLKTTNKTWYEPGYNITCINTSETFYTASTLFFELEVIQRSKGLEPENIGVPIWKLALCMLLSWIIVVACLYKGVKSSGKVVYFTATFPYIILIILLIRGAILPGALDGVKYFIVPEWRKFSDITMWVDAAGQMFFSLSVCFGGIIMFGSYNNFRNNIYADALIISLMDLVTSVIAGFVIFTILGHLSYKTQIDISDIAQKGYGLAFVAYPEALATLPLPQLWSVLFFFMLFTLGLDSEFALLETMLTCLQDEYPKLRKYKGLLCIVSGVICFFLALPCICPGGDYVVTLMDYYGADFAVLCVASCESIAVMWVYGFRRFLSDVKFMIGFTPNPSTFWCFCWVICSPILITVLFVYRMVKYNPPNYPDLPLIGSKKMPYPEYAQALGWLLTIFGLVPIPLYFLYKLFTAKSSGFADKMAEITTPTAEWRTRRKTVITGVDNLAMGLK